MIMAIYACEILIDLDYAWLNDAWVKKSRETIEIFPLDLGGPHRGGRVNINMQMANTHRNSYKHLCTQLAQQCYS